MLSFGVVFIVKIRYNRGKLSLEKDITMQDKLLITQETYYSDKKTINEGAWKITSVAHGVAFNLMLEKLQEQGVNIPDTIKLVENGSMEEEAFHQLNKIVAREKGLTPDDVVWETESLKAKAKAAYANKKEWTETGPGFSWEENTGYRYWDAMHNNEWKRITKKDVENCEIIYNTEKGMFEVNLKKVIDGIKEREKGIALVKEMKGRNLVK